MGISDEEIQELKHICPEAKEMAEGGIVYLYLPGLKLPAGLGVVDALLCPQSHSGYPTRLFLSAVVQGKGANWTSHVILSRTWHTWSWNYIPAGQRPAEILAQHLRAFR